MVLTASKMLPLGVSAPDFELVDVVTNARITLARAAGRAGLLISFLSAECPYVLHVIPQLRRLADETMHRGIGFVGIASNDPVVCPEDAPEALAKFVRVEALGIPVGVDPAGEIAAAFGAACTPDFFLFDASNRLVYRGRMDETRPWSSTPATGAELEAGLHAVLAGAMPGADQAPSLGCSIKRAGDAAYPGAEDG